MDEKNINVDEEEVVENVAADDVAEEDDFFDMDAASEEAVAEEEDAEFDMASSDNVVVAENDEEAEKFKEQEGFAQIFPFDWVLEIPAKYMNPEECLKQNKEQKVNINSQEHRFTDAEIENMLF